VIHRHRRPEPPLSDFVALLWYYERAAPAHAAERVLPNASFDIIIDLRDDGLRLRDRTDMRRGESIAGALACGPRSEFLVIDTAHPCAIMGVHFRPGGAFAFFDLPMDALWNAHVPLEALWRRGADELRERLSAAPTIAEKFRCLERFLLRRLARPEERSRAVGAALGRLGRAPAAVRMAALAEELGVSQRRFIRLFREEVGLTPKAFARVRRFQSALRLINAGAEVDWPAVALASGYYDQAHFIHDFRAFCGLTPTAYLMRRGEHMTHVRAGD
jgi:methylphosphotriester-DNA--protein-cysteine methyltransferase